MSEEMARRASQFVNVLDLLYPDGLAGEEAAHSNASMLDSFQPDKNDPEEAAEQPLPQPTVEASNYQTFLGGDSELGEMPPEVRSLSSVVAGEDRLDSSSL